MKKATLFLLLSFGFCKLNARDLPVFYRAPLFPGSAKRVVKDWTSKVEIGFHRGSTRKSWGHSSGKQPLLSLFGPMDVVPLGLNLNSTFAEAPTSTTKNYWGAGGKFNPAADNLVERTNCDGLFDIKGKITTEQVSIILEQQLFSGFFIQAFIPYRHIHLRDIKYCNLGADVFSIHKDAADPLNPAADNVFDKDTFFDKDFPQILKENSFCVPARLCCAKDSQSGISDIYLSVGWAYSSDEQPKSPTFMRLTLQAGGIFPVGGKRDENSLFCIPLGYNDQWGIRGQIIGEIGLWEKFLIGAHGNATVFFRDDRCVRMMSDKAQKGWFRLGRGKANVDPSALWQACVYAKGECLFDFLTLIAGYSFTHHEGRILKVEDDKFLQSFIEGELIKQPENGFDKRRVICQDPIVNCDNRYNGWEYHTLHFRALFDTRCACASWFAPIVTLEASYPVAGKQVFATEMYGGSLTAQASWDF